MIFLASQASNTLHLLLPSLDKKPSELSVAFIPTAGDMYQEKPWMSADKTKLEELGFQVEEVNIDGKTREELQSQLSSKDIIFVAGGNTFYLLKKSQESSFDAVVHECMNTGAVYIGSSAGSVIAGPDIEYVSLLDDPKVVQLESTTGLGLVDFEILPHANNPHFSQHFEKIIEQYSKHYEIKSLHDNQAILIRNGASQLVEA